jgi:hypothetical protein
MEKDILHKHSQIIDSLTLLIPQEMDFKKSFDENQVITIYDKIII